MPDRYEELKALFKNQVGKSEMAGTAYDTAWVASVPDPEHPDRPAFPQALEWLRLHQNSDGSWGAEIEYGYDRILSTLMAILTLAKWKQDQWVEYQISAGIRAIWVHLNSLQREPNETAGFELILPTLLGQAKAMGFQLPYAAFDKYYVERQQKLALIPSHLLYSRQVTSAFSIEFLGNDVTPEKLARGLQEDDGSVATSPSATSYLLIHGREPRAMDYVEQIVRQTQGAIPAVMPFEIFERAWALNNLYWVNHEFPLEAQPHLEAMDSIWSSRGLAHSTTYTPVDLDDTAWALAVLARAGRRVNPDALFQFEADDHFRCYAYERSISSGVHVHLLDALKALDDFPGRQRMIDKALRYLDRTRIAHSFWFDKWHASPYYITAHAIITLIDLSPALIENALTWLMYTQRPDGGWGYRFSTTEETAHAVQALVICRRHGINVPPYIFQHSAEYLEHSAERKNRRYKPLWLCKVLYSPTLIVESTILSALAMIQRL